MTGGLSSAADTAPQIVTASRPRPRLSRTLAAARWREYTALLETALQYGYRVLGVEQWLTADPAPEGPLLVVRHDVDQHPRSALAMARLERRFGIRSAWYFRWRTADPATIAALREDGCAVGFHYETLSRLALERGARDAAQVDSLVPEARSILAAEVATFLRLHGPIRTICPHGDSRAPLARNARLVKAGDVTELGVEYDVNEAMRGSGLAHWLTDRTRGEGGWAAGPRPAELFAARLSPILCVVHPNNWSSGPSLWLDRVRAAVRTGIDAPPA